MSLPPPICGFPRLPFSQFDRVDDRDGAEREAKKTLTPLHLYVGYSSLSFFALCATSPICTNGQLLYSETEERLRGAKRGFFFWGLEKVEEEMFSS